MGAQTEMPSEPEGQMVGRVLAPHIQTVGIGEHLLVAVRRRERQIQKITRLERDPPQGERLLARSCEVLDRRLVPDQLVGGMIDEVGLGLEQGEFLGMLNQCQ